MYANEIHYKIAWRARSSYPGHHSSQQKGGGLQFRNHVPLIDAPDPRRFDVRASLRDPFEQIQVRVYQQTSAIPVFLIADLSASMGFNGVHAKTEVLSDLLACLSYSAYRTGDKFGFIGCEDDSTEPIFLPPSLNRAAGLEMAESLRHRPSTARNSNGLLHASRLLGTRRALVFLVSDFHVPFSLTEDVLASLAYHDVIPIVVWDRCEYERLPNFGIARLRDPETGRQRLLIMRPSLKNAIRQTFTERREKLFRLFQEFGRAPLILQDGFKADEVTRYFYE